MDRLAGKQYLITNQPLFKDLKDSDRRYIAEHSQLVEYKKGEVIYERGMPRDNFYIIATGSVLTYLPADDGSVETPVETLRKGNYFGLLSLLAERDHSVSARAETEARILQIDEKSFDDILKRCPELAITFTAILSRRIRIDAAGRKEIIQSNIIGVSSDRGSDFAARYALILTGIIESESEKSARIFRCSDLNDDYPEIESLAGLSLEEIETILRKTAASVPFLFIILPDENQRPEKYYSFLDHLHALHSEKSAEWFLTLKSSEALSSLPYEDYLQGIRLPEDLESREAKIILRRLARTVSQVRVGLSLGGGAAFGLAQIGLLKVLERENLIIDMVSGTSIGALIGTLWASGLSASEIENVSDRFDSFFKVFRLMDINIPTSGLIGGSKIRDFLDETLHGRNFEDFSLPIKVMSCNISRREEVIIGSGRAADGVLASIAIPGLFHPVLPGDGRILVDGGMVNPLPVSVLSQEGINRIIAVNSMPSPEAAARSSEITTPNILDILLHSFYSLQYRIARYAHQEADVYMNPIMDNSAWYEFHRAKEFIAFGEEEAEKSLPEIRALFQSHK